MSTGKKVVPAVELLLYGRREAAIALSISVRKVDEYLAQGAFDTTMIGRRRLIKAASLRRFAASNHFGSATRREKNNRDNTQNKERAA